MYSPRLSEHNAFVVWLRFHKCKIKCFLVRWWQVNAKLARSHGGGRDLVTRNDVFMVFVLPVFD